MNAWTWLYLLRTLANMVMALGGGIGLANILADNFGLTNPLMWFICPASIMALLMFLDYKVDSVRNSE